jgi:hypothetical protein
MSFKSNATYEWRQAELIVVCGSWPTDVDVNQRCIGHQLRHLGIQVRSFQERQHVVPQFERDVGGCSCGSSSSVPRSVAEQDASSIEPNSYS